MSKSYQKHVWVNKGQPPISANNLNQMEQGIGDGIDLGNDNEKAINDHLDDTNNPHHVTAAQVGLGNVNNTSDLNKPVSTATKKLIDDEVARAKQAESAASKAASDEADRAKGVENGLNTRVNATEKYVSNAIKFVTDADGYLCVES